MREDKAFVSFQGRRLIEYSINLMERICDEIIISANHPQYESFGLPVIRDNYHSIGPIGGIEASLAYSKTTHNLVIPNDTPFITLSIFYQILNNLNHELSVVPLINGDKPQPLTAYYSKEILPQIRKQIRKKNYKMQDLLKETDARFLDFTQNDIFRNLNAVADLEVVSYSFRKIFHNMILIAGDGRNVGKTHLSCKIIKHLSGFSKVIGIKISPHYHELADEDSIVYKNEQFTIVDEKSITRKDSSLMLQAGARKVFFIMAEQEHLEKAFSFISDQLLNHSIVCESGGLHKVVQPGLFLFVKNRIEKIQKKHLLKYAPVIVTNHQKSYDFNEQCIGYKNDQITLENLI